MDSSANSITICGGGGGGGGGGGSMYRSTIFATNHDRPEFNDAKSSQLHRERGGRGYTGKAHVQEKAHTTNEKRGKPKLTAKQEKELASQAQLF